MFKGIDLIVASCCGPSDLLGVTALFIECERKPEVYLVPQLKYETLTPESWSPGRNVLFVDYWATEILGRRPKPIEVFASSIRETGHQLVEFKRHRPKGLLGLERLIRQAVYADTCSDGFSSMLYSLSESPFNAARTAARWADSFNEDIDGIPTEARQVLDKVDIQRDKNPHLLVDRTLGEFGLDPSSTAPQSP